MDFFEHQERARRKTGVLVFYFVVAVILIVLGVDAVALIALAAEGSEPAPEIAIVATVATLALIGGATWWKSSSLASGGAVVADMMGGTPVSAYTQDPMERRLINVVEEMALAAGIAVPAVYVLSAESSINALAAGHSPSNAVIAVSRGALESLTRDELQGVVAHEFSHVLYGDMRLNLRLIGILHGILVLAIAGRLLLRASGSGRSRKRSSSGGALLVLGLGLLVVGYIGVFFARLIKSAISRQRELLADASSVQYTRNPSGILGALIKIRNGAGSRLESPRTDEVSHLLFASGLTSLFATHPPLEARIRAIDPSRSLETALAAGGARATAATANYVLAAAGSQAAAVCAPAFSQAPSTARVSRLPIAAAAFAPAAQTRAAMASVGRPSQDDLALAAGLLAKLPADLRSRLASAAGARATVYALLLDANESVRSQQLRLLDKEAPLAAELHPIVAALGAAARLPLTSLAVFALRPQPEAELDAFFARLRALAAADGKIQPFELLMDLYLEHVLGRSARLEATSHRTLRAALPDLRMVLAFLAHAGAHASAAEAERAFRSGLDQLGGGIEGTLLPASALTPEVMRSALAALRAAVGPVRALVIGAAAACALSDGKVRIEEWETLRVLGAVLECPLPPALSNLSPPGNNRSLSDNSGPRRWL